MDKTKPAKRATSLAELRAITQPLFSAAGYAKGLSLKLRPTDVVITPFSKSGTTWTQQIVHTLRTRGDMDFDDISRVVPWIETSVSLGLDLDAEQRANPRAFKSHLSADLVPKGGRYINVVRNFGDAAVSFYKFNEGWFLEPGCVPIDEFVESQIMRDDNYFKHLLSWWPRRNEPDVLFLAYELMLRNSSSTIERIAEFIGINLDQELLALTLEHSSLPFMLAHKNRFDDALMRTKSEEMSNLPTGSDSAKVRDGRVGSRTILSNRTLARIDETWREQITPVLGFNNYDEMLAELE
ncbi:MAG: sulfotransferase domain-containing protein [Gammaproteobacteria bacterium]|nr:sulfotransferase domain-containing protein [Gammaproteobacteria bacterium]